MSSLKKKKQELQHPSFDTKYSFTKKEIDILQYGHIKHMHPGDDTNIRIFWPLYLESRTQNVELLNYNLVFRNKKFSFEHFSTPLSSKFKQNRFLSKSDKKKRFLYIVLSFKNPQKPTGHANALIYDYEKQILERFEPHGSGNPLPYTILSQQENKKMKEILSNVFDIKIKRIMHPKSSCPARGWQVREGNRSIDDSKFNTKWKIRGYCVAWSMYYVILRMNNLDLSPKEIQTRAFKDSETTSNCIHKFYYDFLRFKLDLLKKTKVGVLKKFLNQIKKMF